VAASKASFLRKTGLFGRPLSLVAAPSLRSVLSGAAAHAAPLRTAMASDGRVAEPFLEGKKKTIGSHGKTRQLQKLKKVQVTQIAVTGTRHNARRRSEPTFQRREDARAAPDAPAAVSCFSGNPKAKELPSPLPRPAEYTTRA
jgi:hypothetical protein